MRMILFVVISLLMISCEKNTNPEEEIMKERIENLIGRWEDQDRESECIFDENQSDFCRARIDICDDPRNENGGLFCKRLKEFREFKESEER